MKNEALCLGRGFMMNSNLLHFAELMSYAGGAYIEFRMFPSANTKLDIYHSMLWADRVFKHYEIKKPCYGKDWRVWKEKPTEAERAAVPWEE